MPKSNREQVEEIRSNHKHDEELLEDGKGYRMIRARYRKEAAAESSSEEVEVEADCNTSTSSEINLFLPDLRSYHRG